MKFARTRTPALIAIVMMVGILTACGADPVHESHAAPAFEAVSTHETAALNWEKSWESAFARASNEDKSVLVSFEAEWCVWCKKLDSTTYRDSAVMALISDQLVPLTLDVDGAGEALSDTHNVESLPTVLVFSPSGEEQGRINGFLPPGQFVAAVSDILQES